MANLETLKIDIKPALRKAMIEGVTDIVDAAPQYRFAVILELLKRDPLSRKLLADAMGEAVAADLDLKFSAQAETWDEVMLEVLTELRDTPGGRGAPLSPRPETSETA